MINGQIFIDRYRFLILAIIIVSAISLRIYSVSQKEAYHIDEVLSFKIINTENFFRDDTFDNKYKDKWVSGKYYIDYYCDIKKENLKKDIRAMMLDTKDPPHPNLYYLFLRVTLFNGLRGIDGPFKYYGVGLNILFYSIGAIFLFTLYKNIYQRSIYALLAVFLYSFSIGAISTSLFIRMYEIFTFSVIATTMLTFKLMDKEKPTLFHFVLLSMISSFGFLSHYYYSIYITFLFLIIVFHYIKKGGKRAHIFFYGISFLQGFLNAQAIYPKFVRGFLTANRAKEAYSTFDINYLIQKFVLKAKVLYEVINEYIIYFLPFVLLILSGLIIYSVLTKNKIKHFPKEIYLIAISICLGFIFIYLAPYNSQRYLFGIFPVFIVFITATIRIIPWKKPRVIAIISFCIVYLLISLNIDNKAHLYRGIKEKLIFRNNPDIPTVFVSSTRWKRGIVTAFFIENQKYKLIAEKKPVLDLSEINEPKLFLIIEDDKRVDIITQHIKQEKWLIKGEYIYPFYTIMAIEKENSGSI